MFRYDFEFFHSLNSPKLCLKKWELSWFSNDHGVCHDIMRIVILSGTEFSGYYQFCH